MDSKYIYRRIHNDLEREGENIDILMYKERKIMEDIEKACGKKTRRVDATSVHWTARERFRKQNNNGTEAGE